MIIEKVSLMGKIVKNDKLSQFQLPFIMFNYLFLRKMISFPKMESRRWFFISAFEKKNPLKTNSTNSIKKKYSNSNLICLFVDCLDLGKCKYIIFQHFLHLIQLVKGLLYVHHHFWQQNNLDVHGFFCRAIFRNFGK